MQVASSPVSILNMTFSPQNYKFSVHGLLPTVCTAPRNFSSVMFSSKISTDDFERHHLAKYPMCPHVRHFTPRAGHTCIACHRLTPKGRLPAIFVANVPSMCRFETSLSPMIVSQNSFSHQTWARFQTGGDELPNSNVTKYIFDIYWPAKENLQSNLFIVL